MNLTPALKREYAEILMTFGVGAEALHDLGVSQQQFWKFVNKRASRRRRGQSGDAGMVVRLGRANPRSAEAACRYPLPAQQLVRRAQPAECRFVELGRL